MDSDQIKGKLQGAFGKVEEAVGKAVGSNDLQNAGTEDRLKGGAKETWGNAKDTAREVTDTARTDASVHADHASAEGESLRSRIVNGAENLKDSINAKLDNAKADEQAKREEIRREA
ncbi:hypothetical protein Terro_3234 [Terriglobus roseus DSM 18391]|uniref:CsbD-like domain-containing protein n=1 Tax=Terriglobus roseus (strain DSM 18391 / NRRL B-41598 / KBS 63) TaxID=926566 RepID=I3ZJN4_TERRK|nr:CsbD family protein [Terriglobus roseus]AFL89452.1 hypothetical protein Terro_3234 [Terriglobus roseus DSM 18391]